MEPKRWKAYPKYFPYKLNGRYKTVFPDVTEETKINLLPLNINQDKQSKYKFQSCCLTDLNRPP